jgi:D-sedoheptulose 7-phosphate isomerase
LAAELVNRYKKDREGLPAIALATDMAVVTSISNDYDYTDLFSRQLKAIGHKGDIAIAISTSGNSPNVLKAVQVAKEKGLITIGFAGKDGGKLAGLVDYSFIIPSNNTARIQEAHITLGHILCELIEDEMFK